MADCAAPSLALVFSTFDYPAEIVAAAISESLGGVPWAGCVTPAILADGLIFRRGIAVGIIDSPAVRVGVGAAGPTAISARSAGRRAARDALREMPLTPTDRQRAMIVFARATGGDASEALRGATSVAGAGVAWSGGGIGARDGGDLTAVYAQNQALHDHVVAVALDFPSRVGAGVQHGWQPIGAPAMVTRAVGVTLHRLEDRPAFDIYRAVAEERGHSIDRETFADFARTHPLGIPQANGEYLIRDPISVDDAGALVFMASIPEGALIRVMEGSPAMLIEAARIAASTARADGSDALGGALVFDCVSRYSILADRMVEELAACREALGQAPVLGCLTFGEVGAFGARIPQFHNKTMVVLALPA